MLAARQLMSTRQVVSISRDYVSGYQAAKDFFSLFSINHYYNYIMSEDYREGFLRALFSQFIKKDYL